MGGVYYLPELPEQARAQVDANFGSEEVIMDHSKLAEMLRDAFSERMHVNVLFQRLRRWDPKGNGIVICGRYASYQCMPQFTL